MVLDSPVPAWLAWGADARFLCNDACLPLTGRDVPGALGAPAREVWGAPRPDFVGRLDRVLATGHATADVNAACVPLRGDDGRIAGVLVLLPRRTARETSEARRFRLMADGLPVPIWVHDATGALRFVNRAYRDFFGVTQEQVQRPDWRPLVHPDWEQGYVAAFLAALEARRPFHAVMKVRDAAGEWRWVESRGAPSYGDDGSYLGMVGCGLDVTERHLAEEALQRSVERFRVAQDSSLVAFTVLRAVRDDAGAIVDFAWEYANPAAARIIGHPIEALVGRRLLDVLPGNRDASGLFDAYVRVVETGAPHDIDVPYHADGIDGAFRNVASRLGDGVAVWFLDVTERLSLLAAERAARADADAAMRAKDDFLAVLSHELRTPLGNVVSWSRLLQERFGRGDEFLRRGLTVIESNASVQAQLISDLLDVNRLVAGKVTLELQAVDLCAVVEREVTAQRPAADARGVALGAATGGEPLLVEGDPTRLQQVVANLLSNAIKFTPRGGQVAVTARLDGARVELEVRDTGEGIAPELLPHVFERFRQAESGRARRHGGLGLGLAIVQQLVELQGGRVTVASEGAGRGAAFTVRLPAASDAASTSGDGDAATLAGLCVLAVEDQPDMREHLCRVLAERGAEVLGVATAAEAVAYLREVARPPHILVSDIGLPMVDGYELVRTVRRDLGLGPDALPAIAVTAFVREEDRQRALEAGYQGYLTKPWTAGRLVSLIRRLAAARAPSVQRSSTS
jgi:PAS domain S-box-containing protein